MEEEWKKYRDGVKHHGEREKPGARKYPEIHKFEKFFFFLFH